VTLHTAPCDSPETTLAVEPVEPVEAIEVDDFDGWQALAAATLGRLLTDTELAAVERLPTELALDLLFPDLPDAARQEALWALA
jgi:hypothetical protein